MRGKMTAAKGRDRFEIFEKKLKRKSSEKNNLGTNVFPPFKKNKKKIINRCNKNFAGTMSRSK